MASNHVTGYCCVIRAIIVGDECWGLVSIPYLARVAGAARNDAGPRSNPNTATGNINPCPRVARPS